MEHKDDIDELSADENRLRQLVRMSRRREQAAKPDVDKAWRDFRQTYRLTPHRRRFSLWHLSAAALVGAAAMWAAVWIFPRLLPSADEGSTAADVVAMHHDVASQQIRLEDEGRSLNLTGNDSISFKPLTASPVQVAQALPASPRHQRLSTPRGMDFKVVLPDGSEVWLNAESTIEFPSAFRTGVREVKLKGEAYFKVAHDERAPFIVTSEKMKVRVLGTEFNMRSYMAEVPRVALVEGKVEVMRPGATRPDATLSPGEEARFDADGAVQVQEVDTYAVTQWVKGFFYFHDQPLVEVLRELGRWYNLGVVFHNVEAMDYKIHFSALRNEPIEQAIENLNRLRHVRVQIEGNDVVVY